MLQRFLDPSVLAGLSGLDLVAKTVVDGFISGLHRSPDFGFSQEFAEYRAYNPGDDLRHVDWNVFARSEKMFLKRYRGETNCQVSVLLDASRSMKYGSRGMEKMEYAKFLAASICYLAHLQRDAAGLIVFDSEVRQFVPPSTRQGQIMRLRDPAGQDLVTRTIRTREGYLVPRGGGRYVLGATVEERGWDTAPTSGATLELIRDLAEVVPGVLELEIEELGAGLRPGTPDNLPIIGEHGGVVWATGHFRNGILLADVTAQAVAQLLAGNPLPEWAAACDPARFAEVAA